MKENKRLITAFIVCFVSLASIMMLHGQSVIKSILSSILMLTASLLWAWGLAWITKD